MDRLELLEAFKHSENALAIIEALKRTPDEVATAVSGVPEDVLRRRPTEGEWSMKELIGHLRDNAEVWDKRLFMIWSQPDPFLPSFDQEEYVRKGNYQEADVNALIADMRKHREKTVTLLNHAPDWSRTAQHQTYGRRSLRQFLESLLDHEREHLAQIGAMKKG